MEDIGFDQLFKLGDLRRAVASEVKFGVEAAYMARVSEARTGGPENSLEMNFVFM